jgi:hypothetical protein
VPLFLDAARPGITRHLTRAGTTALVTANALVAAVSGLGSILAGGSGRTVLVGISAVAGVAFLGHLAVLRLKAGERRRLEALSERYEKELSALRRQVDSVVSPAGRTDLPNRKVREAERDLAALRDAVMSVLTSQPVVYRDDLDITYVIGRTPREDVVIERRTMIPADGVAMALFTSRLTVPSGADAPRFRLRDMDVVTRSEDDRISIRALPLSEQTGMVRCLYVFSPPLMGPTTWTVRYRVPGLWTPLRTTGSDELTWSPAPRRDEPARSVIGTFSVSFVLPAGSGEDHSIWDGSGAPVRREDTVPVRFSWSTTAPVPGVHRWRLERHR